MKRIIFMVMALLALAITTQAQYVKRVTITQAQITKVEEYHESDELVYRSEDYLVFLNQTSTVKDTLYVYTFGKPQPNARQQPRIKHSAKCTPVIHQVIAECIIRHNRISSKWQVCASAQPAFLNTNSHRPSGQTFSL